MNQFASRGSPSTPPASTSPRARRLQEYRLQLELLDKNLAKKQADDQRLRAQVTAYQARVEAAPTRESEMTELTRDYKTLQDMYTSLLSRKEDAKIAANLERRQIGEQFKLLDPARLPEKPFSPNRQMLNLMGLGAGAGLGLLLIGLLEYRDQSFKTDHEVMRVLSLPVLAVVPMMQSPAEKKWAFKKRLLIASACSATVIAGLGVVAYTFLF